MAKNKRVAIIVIAHADFPQMILHGKRNDNDKWAVPGGHIEDGESPIEGAVRELEEETGIKVKSSQLKLEDTRKINEGLTVYMYCASIPKITHLDASDDPDAEFGSFGFIDPRQCDDLHVPFDKNLVCTYLDKCQPIEKASDYGNYTDVISDSWMQAAQIYHDQYKQTSDKSDWDKTIHHVNNVHKLMMGKYGQAQGTQMTQAMLDKRKISVPLQQKMKKQEKDIIPGGLADKKKPSDFDRDSLVEGIHVEMEHTSDRAIAREIAMDHLTEDPHYYKKLKTIEKRDLEPGNPYKFFYQHDKENDLHYVDVKDEAGRHIGNVQAEPMDDGLVSNIVSVHHDHRRKGIATAMYKFLEQKSGRKMVPDLESQTESGAALWNQPNRPFGTMQKAREDAMVPQKLRAEARADRKATSNDPYQSQLTSSPGVSDRGIEARRGSLTGNPNPYGVVSHGYGRTQHADKHKAYAKQYFRDILTRIKSIPAPNLPEDITKAEAPPRSPGEIHPIKPYVAKRHTDGNIGWYYNPARSTEIDKQIDQSKPHFLARFPEQHRPVIEKFINAIRNHKTRHSVMGADVRSGPQNVRARHILDLLQTRGNTSLNVTPDGGVRFVAARHGTQGGTDHWDYNGKGFKYLGRK